MKIPMQLLLQYIKTANTKAALIILIKPINNNK